jgi:REP element-mobilizing transposase RayT
MHESFYNFCIQAKERNVLAGCYMIMPDHIHLFVRFGGEVQISMWIKSLKNSLSKSLRLSGKQAPHWQKGYFDHLIRSEASYEKKWIYTRENPVRKGLVAESGYWPYQGEVNPLPFT